MKRFYLLIISVITVCAYANQKVYHTVPDSVYLRAYTTTEDAGRSGLRLDWSVDQKQWFQVANGYGFLSSDFGPWGDGKRMYDPVLRRENGQWVCVWKLTESGEAYAKAYSPNLCDWGRQSYFSKAPGEEPKILKVAYQDILVAQRAAESNRYRESLFAETTAEDAVRFKNLTQVRVKVKSTGERKQISDKLIGIFFEDISYAADGGLYAEMVRNRDFEFSAADHKGWNSTLSWELKGDDTTFIIDSVSPIHANNPHYAVLTVDVPGASLVNTGFDGYYIKKDEKYDFSIFIHSENGGRLKIGLVDPETGATIAGGMVSSSKGEWKKQHCTLNPSRSIDHAILTIEPLSAGIYYLDMVSLFPKHTFKDHGLRQDLAQTLADLQPKFVRFPGGCVAHGNGVDNIYDWKGSIGPLESRKPLPNIWNYHQTRGLGYHEYFQFCEDIGAEPLPVVAAGVPCQNSGRASKHSHDVLTAYGQQTGIPMEAMDAYVQDILDLIEYANGDAKKTAWGKKRAENGHSKPFNLKYIGIGNEDQITDVFEERFRMIYKAVQDKYPEITVIGTVGPFYKGSDYTEGWKLADNLNIPMVDEHYYNTPGWFIYNQDFYDKYDRNKSKVYLGEYAAHLPGRPNNIETALSEALYLTAVERNGDVVQMSSYAPLLAKEGHTNWNPDLIYFNNKEVKPTVGYFVQQLFSKYSGTTYLGNQLEVESDKFGVKERIGFSSLEDERGNLILKMVNLLPVEVNFELSEQIVNRKDKIIITETLLRGSPSETNAKPVERDITIDKLENYVLQPYSFVVIKIQNK